MQAQMTLLQPASTKAATIPIMSIMPDIIALVWIITNSGFVQKKGVGYPTPCLGCIAIILT